MFDLEEFKSSLTNDNVEDIKWAVLEFEINQIAEQMLRNKLIERMPNEDEVGKIMEYSKDNGSSLTLIIEGIQCYGPVYNYV